MAIINNSFKMGGKRQSLEHLLADWKIVHDNSSDIDEYDHYFTDDGMLVLFFDHDYFDYEEYNYYVKLLKRMAKKHQVDFNCAMMDSWDFDATYSILTYRAAINISKTYKMTNSLKNRIQQTDDEFFMYKDRKFHESDVPGVLFEAVLKDHYGLEKFELKPGGLMET